MINKNNFNLINATIEENFNNQLEFTLPKLMLDRKKIKLIELFGGIGSQAKAFEILSKYSSDVIFYHHQLIEFDKSCVKSYNAIHNTSFIPKDITKISYNDLNINNDEHIYLLTYSFPCQDLSTIGKGRGMEKGSGTRSSLLWEVERILLEGSKRRLPEILLMENVPQVNSNKNRMSFYLWKKSLEELGYRNFINNLNAKDYGIPQNRLRCFMISLHEGNHYYFPNKIPSVISLDELLEEWKSVNKKYILSNKSIRSYLYYEKEYNRKEKFLRSLKRKGCLFTITTQPDNDTANFVISNNNIRLKALQESKNDKLEKILNGNIRRLTPSECIRAMGFTKKDYDKISQITSETQIYKQAGNSIVVPVLIAIFSQLYNNINYEKIIRDYILNEIL